MGVHSVNEMSMGTRSPNRVENRRGRQSRQREPWRFPVWTAGLLALLLWATQPLAFARQPLTDRAAQVRALVSSGQLDLAKCVVDEWLQAQPEDLDARIWHARLQAWTNHWKEAESEYRELIRHSPDDVDLLAGLADVLYWQRRSREALPLLDRGCELDARRADIRLRRAQVLQQMGRMREARSAYEETLARDAASVEAKRGLEQLREDTRHELRLGGDADFLTYASDARAFWISQRSRWNQRLSTAASFTHYKRFAETAARTSAEVTLRLSPRDSFTFGGAGARDSGIVPRAEAQFEYGHGFSIGETGIIRGIEVLYQQRWMWYRDARVLLHSPGLILYLPKGWTWLFRPTASRVAITGTERDWKPSGWTRLAFPVTGRLGGHVLFSAGTEDFSYFDQLLQTSARTWGGGLRLRIASGQEITGYGQYQSRSNDQAQTSFGVSYAIHF